MYFSFFLLLTKKINYISWCFSHFSLSLIFVHCLCSLCPLAPLISPDHLHSFTKLATKLFFESSSVDLNRTNTTNTFWIPHIWLRRRACSYWFSICLSLIDTSRCSFDPPSASSREFCWPQFQGLPFYVCVKLEIRVQEAFSCVLVQRRVEKRRRENCSNEEFLWYGTWVSFL